MSESDLAPTGTDGCTDALGGKVLEKKLALLTAAILVPILVVVSACGGGGAPAPTAAPAAPAATKAPAATSAPMPTLAPAATKPAGATPAATPAGPASVAGDLVAGKAVFDQNCNSCHPGGDKGAGPALRGRSLSADRIKNQVRNGGGGMPAYPTSAISDQQLNDLVAYVQSLK